MNSYPLADLEPGTVFECQIYTESGLRLAEPYTPLDSDRLEQLKHWGISTIEAESPPMPEDVKEQYEKQAERTHKTDDAPADTTVRHEAVEEARSLSEGLKNQVRSSFEESFQRTQNLIKPISQGLIQDSSRIYKALQPMMESIWHLPRAVLFLLADRQLEKNQEYINLYSLKTAIYSMLLAREMEYDRDEAQIVGAGGLVHDIGMLKIPQHIRQKEGGLNDEEREVMESHPQRGARLLRDIEQLEDSVSTVVSEHHEQYDGRGYPHRLSGDDIHPHSRIVNLTMTFTAMTQPRSHRKKRRSIESLQELLTEDQEQFDPDVLEAFLLLMGVYPVGSFVELESGHHAMVVEPDGEGGESPSVKVITNEQGQRLSDPYLVNLVDDPDGIKRPLHADIMGYTAMEFA